MKQVYDKYDDKYAAKGESYESDAYFNLQAREKATEELFFKETKDIMEKYADTLAMHSCKTT